MSTLTVTIAGTDYAPLKNSFALPDKIEERSRLKIAVDTDLSTTFLFGQRVIVSDSVLGTLFTGIVNTDDYERIPANDLLRHDIECVDNTFDIDRLTSNEQYTNQYAGVIVADQHQRYLSAEGITAAYALDIDTDQPDFATGTLSGTVGTTTDAGEGCLELAPAGTDVIILENITAGFASGTLTNVTAANNSLAPTPINAIKLTGTMNVAGLSNAQTFYKIWTGSYVIQSNDALGYFVWVSPSSPEIKATVDLVCSDGTHLRDQSFGFPYADENDIQPAATSDLAGYADGKWYYRFFSIKGFVGKTLSYASVALGGQKTGNYTAYFRNIRVYNGTGGATQVTIFDTSLPIAPQQVQNMGYENVGIAVVPTYNLQNYATINIPLDTVAASVTYGDAVHERISTAYSLATAALLKSSFITWDVTEPDQTKLVIRCALDNGSPIECTKNAAIPNLVAGMSLAGRSLTIYEDFYYLAGIVTPEVAPTLNAVGVSLLSAPNATKNDTAYTTTFAAGESGVSFSSTIGNSSALNLIGATRNWDLSLGTARYITGASSYLDDQTVYLGTAGTTILLRSFEFGNPSAGNESKSRFDFAGQHQNFTAEIDVQLFSDIQIGLVYRSTAFSSNNGSYAYAVMLSETGIFLKKGTNTTGGGAATTLQTVAFTLTDASWHRLKVVVSGSSHSVYLDDVLQFTKTDASFTATGYLGVIGVSPTQAYPSFNFDNFGVVDVLSGTWTSPNIDLSSAASYGNSYISWRDRSQSPGSNDVILVESTINGGTNWYTCTNGSPLQGVSAGQSLTGVNLKIRVTLTTTTAQSMPGLDNLYVLVTGAYSASGTRSTAPLGLDTAVRADQSGLGTAFDGQTWTKTGTGTDAVSGNLLQISNTTGDVHEVLGSRSDDDMDGIVRIKLSQASISAGMELRYVDSTHYYRLSATTTTLSITKQSGIAYVLATTATTLTINTWYRMRFRVLGASPVSLYGRVWADGSDEPTSWTITTAD